MPAYLVRNHRGGEKGEDDCRQHPSGTDDQVCMESEVQKDNGDHRDEWRPSGFGIVRRARRVIHFAASLRGCSEVAETPRSFSRFCATVSILSAVYSAPVTLVVGDERKLTFDFSERTPHRSDAAWQRHPDFHTDTAGQAAIETAPVSHAAALHAVRNWTQLRQPQRLALPAAFGRLPSARVRSAAASRLISSTLRCSA